MAKLSHVSPAWESDFGTSKASCGVCLWAVLFSQPQPFVQNGRRHERRPSVEVHGHFRPPPSPRFAISKITDRCAFPRFAQQICPKLDRERRKAATCPAGPPTSAR